MNRKFENKKILHISPTDIRNDSRILRQLRSLETLENTQLLAFGISDNERNDSNNRPINYLKTFSLISKSFYFIPKPYRYILALFESIIRLSYPAVKYKPSIVHCHDTLFLPIALIVKYFCNAKLVYDAHELESDKAGQSVFLSKCTLFIEKVSWRNIDFLISVSPSIIDWYIEFFGFKENELILNSPQLDEFSNSNFKSDYLREKFGIPSNELIYLYLGIISRKGRGIEIYLESFINYNLDSHLVFMGYGDYVDSVKEVAMKYRNVHYHPPVPHDKVVEISKSADVGLCMIEPISLSDVYCLPNKLFEYAFSNLFVLSSDLPDIKKIIEDYDLGVYCKNERKEFTETISAIRKLNISKKGMNLNRLYPLSWLFQEEKLFKIYRNLIFKV